MRARILWDSSLPRMESRLIPRQLLHRVVSSFLNSFTSVLGRQSEGTLAVDQMILKKSFQWRTRVVIEHFSILAVMQSSSSDLKFFSFLAALIFHLRKEARW